MKSESEYTSYSLTLITTIGKILPRDKPSKDFPTSRRISARVPTKFRARSPENKNLSAHIYACPVPAHGRPRCNERSRLCNSPHPPHRRPLHRGEGDSYTRGAAKVLGCARRCPMADAKDPRTHLAARRRYLYMDMWCTGARARGFRAWARVVPWARGVVSAASRRVSRGAIGIVVVFVNEIVVHGVRETRRFVRGVENVGRPGVSQTFNGLVPPSPPRRRRRRRRVVT